jgi:hypothetical protein
VGKDSKLKIPSVWQNVNVKYLFQGDKRKCRKSIFLKNIIGLFFANDFTAANNVGIMSQIFGDKVFS